MKTINIISLNVAVTTYQKTVKWVMDKAKLHDRAYAVEAASVHGAALSKTNERFSKAISKFDLIVPDGMPLVWALNNELPKEERLTDRVYGPTLMLETFKSSGPEARHFLLGGMQSTLDKLTDKFSEDYPHAKIAGVYSPPFGEWPEDEFDKIYNLISESEANLIWVGLGCPKQEQWIAENKERLPNGVYFAIGAAFTFHAGEIKQAPEILQKSGLEWIFRLYMEPKRLWKRYLTYNTLFLYHYLKKELFS